MATIVSCVTWQQIAPVPHKDSAMDTVVITRFAIASSTLTKAVICVVIFVMGSTHALTEWLCTCAQKHGAAWLVCHPSRVCLNVSGNHLSCQNQHQSLSCPRGHVIAGFQTSIVSRLSAMSQPSDSVVYLRVLLSRAQAQPSWQQGEHCRRNRVPLAHHVMISQRAQASLKPHHHKGLQQTCSARAVFWFIWNRAMLDFVPSMPIFVTAITPALVVNISPGAGRAGPPTVLIIRNLSIFRCIIIVATVLLKWLLFRHCGADK